MPRRQSSIVAEANIKANIAGKSVPAPQLPGTDTTKARGAKRAATVDTATTTGPVSSAKRARKLPNVGDENAMKEKAEQGGVKGAKKTVVTRKKAAKAPVKAKVADDRKQDPHPTQMPLAGGSFAFGRFNTNSATGPGPTIAADPPAVMTRPAGSATTIGQGNPLGPLNTNMSHLQPSLRPFPGQHSQLMQTPYNHPAPAMSPLRQQVFPEPVSERSRASHPSASASVSQREEGDHPSQSAHHSYTAQKSPSVSLVSENRQLARRLAIAEGEVERLRATPPRKVGTERIIDQPAAESYVAVFGIIYNYMLTHGVTGSRETNIKREIKRFQDTETFFLTQKRFLESGVMATWTIDYAGMTKPIHAQNARPGGGQQFDGIGIKHGFENGRIALFSNVRELEAPSNMKIAFDRCCLAFIRLVANQAGYHRLAAWAFHPDAVPAPSSLRTASASHSSRSQIDTLQSHRTEDGNVPSPVSAVQAIASRPAATQQERPPVAKPTPAFLNILASTATNAIVDEGSMPQRSHSAPAKRMTPVATAQAGASDSLDTIRHRADTDASRQIPPATGTQQTLAGETYHAADDTGLENDSSSSSSSDDDDNDDEFHTAVFNTLSGHAGMQELLASMTDQSEFGPMAEAYDHRSSLEGYVAVHDFGIGK